MDTQSTVTGKTGVIKIGKKVSNELPKTKDPSINIRDILNECLASEKHSLVNYQIGINEIINDDLRDILIGNRNNLQTIHTNLFSELFNLGEYQADMAMMPQIQDTADIFNNYTVQLPFNNQN
jgi:hypothetical protein